MVGTLNAKAVIGTLSSSAGSVFYVFFGEYDQTLGTHEFIMTEGFHSGLTELRVESLLNNL